MDDIYYASGGIYRNYKTNEYYFALISPVKGKPYIYKEHMKNKIFKVVAHHSHLYKLIIMGAKIIAELEQESWECSNVRPIKTIELPQDIVDEIFDVIINNELTEY